MSTGSRSAYVHLVTGLMAQHDLFGAQHREVLREVGLLHMEVREQRAGTHLAVSERLDDRDPRGMRQRLEDLRFERLEGRTHPLCIFDNSNRRKKHDAAQPADGAPPRISWRAARTAGAHGPRHGGRHRARRRRLAQSDRAPQQNRSAARQPWHPSRCPSISWQTSALMSPSRCREKRASTSGQPAGDSHWPGPPNAGAGPACTGMGARCSRLFYRIDVDAEHIGHLGRRQPLDIAQHEHFALTRPSVSMATARGGRCSSSWPKAVGSEPDGGVGDAVALPGVEALERLTRAGANLLQPAAPRCRHCGQWRRARSTPTRRRGTLPPCGPARAASPARYRRHRRRCGTSSCRSGRRAAGSAG